MTLARTKLPKLRSVFTSGLKLGHKIHKPKKGAGSYKRVKKDVDLAGNS